MDNLAVRSQFIASTLHVNIVLFSSFCVHNVLHNSAHWETGEKKFTTQMIDWVINFFFICLQIQVSVKTFA